MKLKTIEVFAGTQSFSKVMEQYGHSIVTIDNQKKLNPHIVCDIRDISIGGGFDLMWASPPCTAFSVASIGTHWGGGYRAYEPKTDAARLGIELVQKTISIIRESKPKYWFIENPRGVLRAMPFMDEAMKELGGVHQEVSYCHYGDTRMKPTDIWTNAHWWKPQPMCHNRRAGHNDDCCCMDHEAAPRGAKTGTQGIDGAKDRGRIPHMLFDELLRQLPHDTAQDPS